MLRSAALASPDTPARAAESDSPLRVLIYSLNYAPEPTGIGKFNAEMGAWLAARGHAVSAVVALPYYPWWRVAPEYSRWRFCREVIDGVAVYRSPLFVPTRPTGLMRGLHLVSFALLSLPLLLRECRRMSPDVVFVVEPTLPAVLTARWVTRLLGIRLHLHVQDFESEAARGLGLTGGLFGRLADRLARYCHASPDSASTISHAMSRRLAEHRAPDRAPWVLQNWVSMDLPDADVSSAIRREHGLSSDHVCVLYSGSLGRKQGFEVLIEAARQLQSERHIRFVVCSSGPEFERLRGMAQGLTNIGWFPLRPVEQLADLLASADIHVLPQADAVDSLVLPSKLPGMLASGRPAVVVAGANTELAGIASSCAVVVEPGDSASLAEAIRELAGDPARRADIGARGRRVAEQNFDRDRVLTAGIERLSDALRPGVR